MLKVNNILKKLHTPVWLFILLLMVLILRIPSFFEPYSYGDEMIYLTLGEAIRQGIPLYSGIHDNKPPLLYVMAALAGNLFWFKAILAIWHLVTVFIFWKLTLVILPKQKRARQIATIIFALLTTIPLLEGNIVNAELFMIGPIILAFYILLTKTNNPKNIFASGILFSLATLFKVPAAFDILTIIFLWIITLKKLSLKNLAQIAKGSFFLAAGFLLPIIATFAWFYISGSFREYLIAAFMQNVGYLSSWRPSVSDKPFLEKNLPLLIRSGVVFVGFIILYWKRKKLTREFVFATSWLLITLFAVTLSERPYPHYLIQSVAPVSLLLAFLFVKNTKEQTLAIIPLALAFLVPVIYHFWYYPTTPYYTRFIKYVSGNMAMEAYLDTFGGQVSRNYKVAAYISKITAKEDKIFVWGDGVTIYALAKRFPPTKYVADYHIKDFSSHDELARSLQSDLPSYIIIQPDSDDIPLQIESILNKNYALLETIDGTVIQKLLNPRVRSLII